MDTKIKSYIGKGLALGTIVLGLNALFGGNPIVMGGYDLLPVLAIVTPAYLIFGNKKKG